MSDIITSKSNDKIKYAKKLVNSASFRRCENKFVADGLRLCEEAYKNQAEIDTVFYTTKCLKKSPEIISKIIASSKSSFEVNDDIINQVSDTDTPQGIVCVCAQNRFDIDNDELSRCKKIVILENVQNPSNLGSIFRSCDALGVDLIIICGQTCDIYNPKALRGSMGAAFRVRVSFADDISKCIQDLQILNFEVYATVPNSKAQSIINTNFKEKSAVVLGNEGNGLTQSTIELCSNQITIPMRASAESLNVSVAAGIVIWEMMKGNCHE